MLLYKRKEGARITKLSDIKVLWCAARTNPQCLLILVVVLSYFLFEIEFLVYRSVSDKTLFANLTSSGFVRPFCGLSVCTPYQKQ